jgi:hypothetical protein
MRGNNRLEIKIDHQKIDTKMWNPLLFAVYYKQIELVRFLVEDIGMNTSYCLKEPMFKSESEGESKIHKLIA